MYWILFREVFWLNALEVKLEKRWKHPKSVDEGQGRLFCQLRIGQSQKKADNSISEHSENSVKNTVKTVVWWKTRTAPGGRWFGRRATDNIWGRGGGGSGVRDGHCERKKIKIARKWVGVVKKGEWRGPIPRLRKASHFQNRCFLDFLISWPNTASICFLQENLQHVGSEMSTTPAWNFSKKPAALEG